MSNVIAQVTTQDDAQIAQDRFTNLVRKGREMGSQPSGLITPDYALRCATVYNLSMPSALGIGVKNGKPCVQGSYPLGDEAEVFESLVGNSKSVAKHRAARAMALGFSMQDVDDLEFIASTKQGSKSKDALLAWVRAFRTMAEAQG